MTFSLALRTQLEVERMVELVDGSEPYFGTSMTQPYCRDTAMVGGVLYTAT